MGRIRRLTILFLLAAPGLIAQDVTHTMERGETLYTIARRYETSVEFIIAYNDISDPTRIPVGAVIRIPGSYVVQDGEYIFSIAQKLGVPWLELLEANGLERDDVVRPGDVLVIPGTSPTIRASQSEDEEPQTTDASAETPDAGITVPTAPLPTGKFEWPHPGRRESFDGKFPGTVMNGSVGDPFFSVTTGLVEYVGPFSSFGKLILVRGANGYLYGYAGAEEVTVSPGERIVNGTQLGTVGDSSAFDSPAVLFTVWRNNRYVDPEQAPRG